MSHFIGVGIFWIDLNRIDLGCWRYTLIEWCFVISIEVSSDHSQLRCMGFDGSHYRESD